MGDPRASPSQLPCLPCRTVLPDISTEELGEESRVDYQGRSVPWMFFTTGSLWPWPGPSGVSYRPPASSEPHTSPRQQSWIFKNTCHQLLSLSSVLMITTVHHHHCSPSTLFIKRLLQLGVCCVIFGHYLPDSTLQSLEKDMITSPPLISDWKQHTFYYLEVLEVRSPKGVSHE